MLLDRLPALGGARIVLASASPRRAELLRQVGIPFEVMPSSFEEALDKAAFPSGREYAVATARGKAVEIARAVRAQRRAAGAPPPLGGVLVIGADTVVQAAGGEILEKPDDDAHARAMLLTLAGREHEVHTGVALVVAEPAAGWKGGRWSDGGDGEDGGDGGGGSDDAIPHEATFVETTRVCFADVPPTEVDAYVSGGEPFGKAGAYGIQGAAALWVARVDGCYNNVVGLPLHALARAVAGLLDDGVIGEG